MNEPVLIVGLGRMGRHHQAALGRLGIDTITVDQAGHAQHATITEALRAAWPHPPIAAAVAVPVPDLAGIARVLIRRGIPTLIEKPMAATAVEARSLAALAEATRTPCAVGYVERHNPAVLALKARLAHDAAPPTSIRAIRQGPEPPHGGESLTDLGTHDLAVAHLLDPDRSAHRTILTGYANEKLRRLTVTTAHGTHEVDYLARTLNGHRIPGPDPLEAQWHAFLYQARHRTYQPLWPDAGILLEAKGQDRAPAAAAA